MEEENQVFGNDAENINEFDSEEKFSIYHKDKEDIEKNIRNSAKELEDFFDSIIQDVPEPSEEEVKKGIEKILERAYPEVKSNKKKKVTLRVLFIAALLSVLSFSCLFVVGNSHNISIENGFVTFAKDTVKVVFFDEDEEEYIDVKTLLEDLSAHGYENVLLPQSLYHCKSSVPEYFEGTGETGGNNSVSFNIYINSLFYSFIIDELGSSDETGDYFVDVKNAKTIVVGNINIDVFEFDNDYSSMRYIDNGYRYIIHSSVSFTDMMNTAQTIVKVEE